MKNFKKYIAALLIFALALSLCSCSLIDRLKPAPAPETVRLTFPEGTTVIQAAQKLEEGGVCTKNRSSQTICMLKLKKSACPWTR